MPDDKATITFHCKKCGEQLTWPDDVVDTTVIKCGKCGENFGTYRDLCDQAMKAASDEVDRVAREYGFEVKG